MITRRTILKSGTVLAVAAALPASVLAVHDSARAATGDKVTHSDEEWQKLLTPEQYQVLRHEATEQPFTSALLDEHRAGNFNCAGCDLPLFSSKTKFESGTGWPSFWQPISKTAVIEKTDTSFGMERTAVMCHRCEGHLGHVFNDGPQPTGLRYCMNGIALKFVAGAA
jgi:peptide-methionine (R)-S-oxide reductase